MAEREGGQWNVAVKNNAVHVERVTDSGEQLFDDLLDPDEARQLGDLLTKHARKVGESEQSDDEESEDDRDSDESQQSGDDAEGDQPDDDESEKKSDQTD
jgi:hypothetical protein